MYYDYFPVLNLSRYNWSHIQIYAGEGDHGLTANDIVFNAILDVSDYINSTGQTFPVEGNCDIPGECATLWFQILQCDSNDCGNFWDRE